MGTAVENLGGAALMPNYRFDCTLYMQSVRSDPGKSSANLRELLQKRNVLNAQGKARKLAKCPHKTKHLVPTVRSLLCNATNFLETILRYCSR
jgi:hypothetical protein